MTQHTAHLRARPRAQSKPRSQHESCHVWTNLVWGQCSGMTMSADLLVLCGRWRLSVLLAS
jgi:hypothetical protein